MLCYTWPYDCLHRGTFSTLLSFPQLRSTFSWICFRSTLFAVSCYIFLKESSKLSYCSLGLLSNAACGVAAIDLLPEDRSLFRMFFGRRPSYIRYNQRSVYMMERLTCSRTLALSALSLHLIPRRRRMQRMLKLFNFRSYLVYDVHVSLPYNRVLIMQAL